MHRRDLASLAALSIFALTAGVGCPDDAKESASGAHPKPAATTAKAPTTATTAAAPTTAAGKADTGSTGAMGAGMIKGVVNFTGKAPEMKVPKKRKDAEFCKSKEVKYNSVLANGGKLADVFVSVAAGSIKGEYKAPAAHAEINQTDCMYSPRIQGVVAGQQIDIKNGDATLHNVHTFKGTETWFNQAQPARSPVLSKDLEDPKVIKFTCDVHPWMRGFAVVVGHPFFAVSGADGTFTINKLPAGKYDVEAWHATYGTKKGTAEVSDTKPGEVTFTYDGTEKEPDENRDEMKDLF